MGLGEARTKQFLRCRREMDGGEIALPRHEEFYGRIEIFVGDLKLRILAPLFRLPVRPNERNGLRAACRLMVDKITTVPKTMVGARVGRVDDEDILRLNRAVLVFLGLAVSPRTKAAI